TYDGKTTKIDDVLNSYSVTLSNGESYTLKAGDLQFNKDPKDKDKYVVSLTAAGIANIQAVDSNYDFTAGDNVTGSYEIKAADATYTLSGTDSKTYDGKITKIDDVLGSYSVTLSNGESYTLKAGDLKFNKDPKDKDKYVVSLTSAGIANIQAVDSNYDFTAGDNVTGSYEIKAAGATYTLSGTDSKIYDGKTTKIDDVLGSYSVTLSNGESYTLKAGDLKFNKDPKDKDKYVVSLTAAGIANIQAVDSNYDFTAGDEVTGSYEIKAAGATYTLSGTDSKTYDGKTTKIDDVLGSYSVTLSNGETYTLKAGDLKFNKDPKNKDKYVVSLTAAGIANIQAVDSNYDFTAGDEVTGSYEIKAAGATYTLSGTDSKTYDGKTTKIDDVLGSYSVTLSNGESYTLKAGI
ncbi:MBG domain-containing protein, partial [Pediococcus argentinicus]|uniref:MBG domain-containing protein n=3 Tax=Pediococcus argentinicus TaxID=480391 RepID=UPI0016BA7EC3